VLRTGLAGLAGIAAIAGSSAGCLDRPVSPATPNTTNVFVQDIRQSTVDKIDLLFMIDNSISMADKQQILAEAVPQLVTRLIQPATDPVTGKEEFKPVVDIHIGVISSSVGGHGGDQCSKTGAASNPSQYDNAHLIGSVRPNLQSYQNLGFLWWDPTGQKATPPGEGNAGNLNSNFASHVTATGETGCGYEASLEAWYRFLVDPNPPADVVVNNNVAEITGVDDVVLQQRKDFLRQDSLVAIIMLSDENDCSIVDGGVNWIAAQTSNPNNTAFHLPRATAACASDPNSPCCRSCASSETAPPSGCGDIASDASCQQTGGVWDDIGDHPNLRCWQQKKRFGLEFLYPTRRYVEGLTQPRICPQWDAGGPIGCDANTRVPNPLFNNSPDGTGTSRDPGLIYLAGIVGVPWQDIATDDSITGAGLEYLTASEITSQGRWDWLTPQCLTQVDTAAEQVPRPVTMCARWDLADEPDDALMIESSLPRTGTGALGLNNGSGVPIADPSAGPLANPVNGHEWNTADADLQYACIFQRSTPLDCSTGASGCDCDDVTGTYTANNPLCQGNGGYTQSQIYAKAFPGQRQLEVLRDFGSNSIVSSICPKVPTGTQTDPSYGYNPAVNAIIERLKEVLAGQCVNRPIDLPKDANGNPDPSLAEQACAIVEVLPNAGGGCGACDGSLNRSDVASELVKPVLNRLKVTGQCGAGQTPCDAANWCMCEIGLAQDLNSCLTDPNSNTIGWCYIDATAVDANGNPAPIGNPDLVEGCEPKRQIRFVGSNTPAGGSTVFIACLGAPLS
jgi:hypothetical protein